MIKYSLQAVALGLVVMMVGCAAPSQPTQVFEPPVYPPAPDEPRFHYERTIISSADVLKDDKDSSFRRFVTGEVKTGIGMGKPFDIDVHQGRIFVSDTERRSVMVFDVRDHKFFEIGIKRPGVLAKPLGIDVTADGELYVCDGSQRVVQVYNRDGDYLRTIGDRDMFSRPSGVAVNAEGTRLYVVDTGGVDSDLHHVLVFDARSGEHLFNIGSRGSGDGEFNLPREVTIANNGNILVVDGGNFRVQIFDKDGNFVRSIGGIGRQSGQFSRPKGIATDSENNVYVSDTAFGNFQIFNTEGQLLLDIGVRGGTGQPGSFMLPSGIAVDEDGRVYVVDQFSKKLDIFRPHSLDSTQGFLASEMGH